MKQILILSLLFSNYVMAASKKTPMLRSERGKRKADEMQNVCLSSVPEKKFLRCGFVSSDPSDVNNKKILTTVLGGWYKSYLNGLATRVTAAIYGEEGLAVQAPEEGEIFVKVQIAISGAYPIWIKFDKYKNSLRDLEKIIQDEEKGYREKTFFMYRNFVSEENKIDSQDIKHLEKGDTLLVSPFVFAEKREIGDIEDVEGLEYTILFSAYYDSLMCEINCYRDKIISLEKLQTLIEEYEKNTSEIVYVADVELRMSLVLRDGQLFAEEVLSDNEFEADESGDEGEDHEWPLISVSELKDLVRIFQTYYSFMERE